MAAAAGAMGVGFADRQLARLEADPAAYLSRSLMRGGAGLIIGGLAMGTVGYFMKAAATTAANNDVATLQNLGSIFSNIQAPTFQPSATGTAPLSPTIQGVQNFFGDVWKDIGAAGNDLAQIGGVMGTLGEDVANGFIDIAKAVLGFVMHFPSLLWNGFVYGIGSAIADVFNWLFPWVVIIGAACLLIGLGIHLGSRAWNAIAGPAWERSSGKWAARQEAKAERGFDRIFGNFKHETKVPVAPEPVAALSGPPEASEMGGQTGTGPVGAAEAALPPSADEAPSGGPEPPVFPSVGQSADAGNGPPGPPAAQVGPPAPPGPPEPAPGVMTRAEAENYLGDRPNRAPTQEEIQKMVDEAEANRQKTLPKKEPEVSGYEESRKAADAFAEAEAG